MQTIQSGYQSLVLIVRLNGDWLFTLGTVILGLLAGAFLGSALVGL
ncbi:MAG: hypothetical protein ACK4OP_02590 [Gemmobacter sp.]